MTDASLPKRLQKENETFPSLILDGKETVIREQSSLAMYSLKVMQERFFPFVQKTVKRGEMRERGEERGNLISTQPSISSWYQVSKSSSHFHPTSCFTSLHIILYSIFHQHFLQTLSFPGLRLRWTCVASSHLQSWVSICCISTKMSSSWWQIKGVKRHERKSKGQRLIWVSHFPTSSEELSDGHSCQSRQNVWHKKRSCALWVLCGGHVNTDCAWMESKEIN